MSKERMEENLNNVLKLMGMRFSYTRFGEPIFVKEHIIDIDAGNTIPARDWMPQQLEMVAHLMRVFPDCKEFEDYTPDDE